jgi:biopolymer transport protein ExbD/biopolymer transport protein TolR
MPIISPRRGGGRYDPVADINITPFVDVMLVLLIVFMITAPMLAAGMLVDLPKAKSAQPLNPREPVIVTVAKDGKLYVGRDEVSRAVLAAAVHAKLGDDQNRQIYVRGDRDGIYGDIVAVMDQLALSGLVKMALVANASPATAVPSAGPEAIGR